MRRWLKISSWALLALLVPLVLLLSWLGGSESGLRFALGQVRGLLGGRLEVGAIEGSLLGGMRLRDVRYYDPAVGDYRLALVEVAPRSRRLLSGELYLTAVSIEGVDITLAPPADGTPAREGPVRLPVLNAPLAMRVDDLKVRGIGISHHDGTRVFAADAVDGRARWAGTRLDVDALAVGLPEGRLELQAGIDTAADWAGEARLAFDLRFPDQPAPLSGEALLRGPQGRPELQVVLARPSAATLDLHWPTQERWQLQLYSDSFDLHGLAAAAPVQSIAVNITGEGDVGSASLRGEVAVDGYGLVLDALDLRHESPRLVLERLVIHENDGTGRLEAGGEVVPDGEAGTGRIDVRWEGINPPLAPPFDRLGASGRLVAGGTPSQLQAQVQVHALVDAQPVMLELQARGDPRGELRIAPLELLAGDGRLDGEARLTLAPAIGWEATLAARDFDPGLLLPDWPGRIDLDARSEGALAGPGSDGPPRARLHITRLGGQLRGRELAGGGRIEVDGGEVAQTALDVRIGRNRLRIDGRIGTGTDAHLRASLADPAAFLPDAGGRLEADLRIRGEWPAVAVAGRVDGRELAWADTTVASIHLDLDARSDFSADNRVQLKATGLQLGGQHLETLELDAGGNEADSRLSLDARSGLGTLCLALAGSYTRADHDWNGQLRTLDITSPQLPETLALREPAALRIAPDSAALRQACLHGADMHLCLDADWNRSEGGTFGFQLARLPLDWLLALAGDETLRASGELGGSGRLRLDNAKGLEGQLRLEGTPGRVAFVGEEAPKGTDGELVAWTRLEGGMTFAGDARDLDATLELSPAGSLRLQASTRRDGAGDEALQGHIDIDLPDLSLLALLTPEIVDPAGSINGRIDLHGTLDLPRAQGRIALVGFGAEIPAVGLRLRDSHLHIDAAPDGHLDLAGGIRTGEEGTLHIHGSLGPFGGRRVPMDIGIRGEHVLVADIPAARVFISPDLRITSNSRGLRVAGDVAIPQAMIRPDLFEGGAVQPSPDVHIVGEEDVEVATRGLPVFADVEVTLGDRVRIDGFGLKGALGGKLDIRERPRRDTQALGEITVTGTYQAYGQDLDIERGRLLFSGPLDNPGLDIRAVRRVEAVTAGLQVTGQARRPVLEVYSVPALDQAEALSYLVLGRPLRQATSSADQSALGTAATAVSTAGGDLLAKSLGARLGLDEVGVGTSRELGAGALTVGKYLSPRLYLGYGRSLFDGGQLVTLRYRLSERYELEVQSGTRDNKAGVNYRLER